MYVRIAALAMFLALPVAAGEADVLQVVARRDDGGTFSFDVTVRHADTGWKHYADKWEVLSPDGKIILGVRTLLHPHEDEQPFTRSLSGVGVPADIHEVVVRARDSVHGFGGREQRVELPR